MRFVGGTLGFVAIGALVAMFDMSIRLAALLVAALSIILIALSYDRKNRTKI